MSKDNATALVNLALLAMQAGHEDQAFRSFKNALEIRPDLVEAHLGMGLAYSRMGEYVEMAECFRKAIQHNPLAVRKWAKASISGPHKWLSFSPEFAHIKGKMGEWLHTQDEADALTRLGATHISKGFDEEAVTALEYCLRLISDYEAAIVLISITYLLLDSKQAGAASRTGANSVLKNVAPRLAEYLFRNAE